MPAQSQSRARKIRDKGFAFGRGSQPESFLRLCQAPEEGRHQFDSTYLPVGLMAMAGDAFESARPREAGQLPPIKVCLVGQFCD